jgi:hypothetical protein
MFAVTFAAGAFTLVTTLPAVSMICLGGIPTEYPLNELKSSEAMKVFHYPI